MNKIEWTNNLSVGVDIIDDQHKQWIKHYNNAVEAIQARHEVVQISESLKFLAEYTEVHFATEEKAMEIDGYPGLEEHKAKHNALRKRLSAISEEFIEDGATDVLSESVERFLGNWLILHIENVDKRYAAFTRETL